ncbi:MAG: outer membrane beta-barrel protein [bacterium]|nr:outer membrane beta-barrel protein [bacterium]
MNKWNTLLAALLFAVPVFAQEEVETETEGNEPVVFEEEGTGKADTTRMNVGNSEFIIITKSDSKSGDDINLDFDEGEEPKRNKKSEPHWAGVDFGVTMLMNENFEYNNFANNPYWNNDAARSQVWNLNIMEHKFNFGTPYVGLTTGLGFSFTSVALRDNYLVQSTADSLFAVMDTVNTYTKNKMKASYLTVPLLLEFNTNADEDRSFYLATGVVGGVRLTSKLKRNGEFEGKEFEERIKGNYNLNSFKLDATARLGYGSWGVFANYSLLPLFDQGKTVEVYPLTFGLSLNF